VAAPVRLCRNLGSRATMTPPCWGPSLASTYGAKTTNEGQFVPVFGPAIARRGVGAPDPEELGPGPAPAAAPAQSTWPADLASRPGHGRHHLALPPVAALAYPARS